MPKQPPTILPAIPGTNTYKTLLSALIPHHTATMCRSYLISYSQPPCTPECSSHLTPRVRPCKQHGTPSCVRSVRTLQLMYCCAFHFQSLSYPQITEFTKTILRYRSKDYGNKYQALHPTVQPHVRQFAYCCLYFTLPPSPPLCPASATNTPSTKA